MRSVIFSFVLYNLFRSSTVSQKTLDTVYSVVVGRYSYITITYSLQVTLNYDNNFFPFISKFNSMLGIHSFFVKEKLNKEDLFYSKPPSLPPFPVQKKTDASIGRGKFADGNKKPESYHQPA